MPGDGTVDVVARAGSGPWVGLAVATAITAVLCGVLELGSTLLMRGVDAGAERATAVQRAGEDFVELTKATLATNAVPLTWDPQLLWRNEPGADRTRPVNPRTLGRDATWSLHVDGRGFRGRPPRAPTPGSPVYRILCVGDSITFGFNVDQDATYPHQLEFELARRYPGRVFEVINAGVPGWSWLQGERFLRLEGLGLRPDVVVIGHGTNDQFFPTTVTDREKLGSTAPWARTGRWLRWQLMRTQTYRAVAHFLPRPAAPTTLSPGCEQQLAYSKGCRRASVFDIAQAIHDVQRLTAAAHADLVVVNPDFEETPAVKGIREGVAADHVRYLDLVALLSAARTATEGRRAARLGLERGKLTRAAEAAPPSTARLLFRVATPERSARYGVQGQAQVQGATVPFDAPLSDDGTHGDEVAGDGVFSGIVDVPGGAGRIEYRFTRDGAREFLPLPPMPSTEGVRRLPLGGDTVVPLARFGEMPFMVELTHPNAKGHRVIAAALADVVARLPSFARVVRPPG